MGLNGKSVSQIKWILKDNAGNDMEWNAKMFCFSWFVNAII